MKRSKLILFLISVLAIVIILPFFVRKVRGPVVNSTNGSASVLERGGSKTSRFFGFFFNITSLKKQNDELTTKIASLEVDSSKIEELEHENSLLKKELGFVDQNKNLSVIPSRIIGREPTSFLDYIIVDKGSADGIKQNAAVISNGTLVGQVKEVYNNSSKVVLITSKDSIVLAMLQDSRSNGILRGGISGLVLEDIVQDVETNPGEYVVTSGLDGEIPQGILIGKTGQLKSSNSDLFKNISIEPIVDFSKLEIIFIVK